MSFTRVDYDDPQNRNLVRDYRISGVPYVVLVDGDGNIVKRRGGNLNPVLYRADVLDVLGAAPRAP